MYDQYYPQGYGMGQQIVRVNGENGARAYQMRANSSVLLLDETAPLVWLAQTDGAGYKTVTPYQISPYQPEPEPDLKQLLARVTKLEERINEQSNPTSNRSSKRQSNESAE